MKTREKRLSKNYKILIVFFVMLFGLLFTNQVKAATNTAEVTDEKGFNVTWEYEVEGGKAVNARIIGVKKENQTIVPAEKQQVYFQNGMSNDYYYEYRHTYNRIYVPDSLGGYTVTSIGDGINRIINPDITKSSFERGVTWVKISNNVTKINNYAFSDFDELYYIEFGSQLKEIGDYAFKNTAMLGAFFSRKEFPASLEKIGTGAFEMNPMMEFEVDENYSIKSKKVATDTTAWSRAWWYSKFYGGRFVLNDGLKEIGDFAFAGQNNLLDLEIPATVTNIGKGAFAYTNITDLTIHTSNDSSLLIDDLTFAELNVQPEEITIPSSVTLGKYVFKKDKGLKKVNLPSAMTEIPEGTFSECVALNQIVKTGDFTKIGDYAFNRCESLTIALFNTLVHNVPEIGKYAFSNCTGLTGNIVIPSSVTNLGEGALSRTGISSAEIVPNYTELPKNLFANCQNLTTITKPSSVKTIGEGCFSECNSLTVNELKNNILLNIETIKAGAFANCEGLTGTLKIISSVKTIGNGAFSNCKNVTDVEFENGVQTIGNDAFAGINLPEILRFPASVTQVGTHAFSTVREAFFEAESVNFVGKWYETRDVITHFGDCKHTVTVINSLPGVRVVNTATNQNFESGKYDCESTVNLKIIVEDESAYPELAVRMTKGGQYLSSPVIKEFLTLNAEKTITLNNITRDIELRVQKSQNDTDLVLREFITKVNGVDVNVSREPFIDTLREENNNEPINYLHTKYPVSVDKNDSITYAIRVYNEDNKPGKVNKVRVYLQDGLVLDEASSVNTQYGWEEEQSTEQGKIISTNYLSTKTINAYPGSGRPEYEEIQVVCKVTKDETKTVTNIAELVESNDVDSVGGNMSLANVLEYKKQDSYQSTDEVFVESAEDDTDYETVEFKNYAKIGYKIAIQKIDSTDLELLNGAKFNLYDENENLLESKVTVQNGRLEFSERISYGEGIETYYIEEVETPNGYKKTIDGKLMLTVQKKINASGNIVLEFICEANELTDYDEGYEFIPITTKEQLAKIGTGAQLAIGNKTYVFSESAKYVLEADIDISGSEWTPISLAGGVLEGNNHKITGLQISNLTAMNAGYKGLFSTFSGIIRNLELNNISITGDEDRVNYSDSTNIAVGGLVGYMSDGKIENVKVTGNVIVTKLKNVGGLIGHTGEGKVVKITNCEFNGTVKANANAGGIIGCAKENVELVGCNSKGLIETYGGYSGVSGGLIGVAAPTGDSDDNIIVEYDSANSTINIAVKNKKNTGKYVIELHKLEKIDGELYTLDGAEFTIYDENMQILTHNGERLEAVKATNGKLEIADLVIDSLKSDVFYIRETKAPEGYDKINDLIKIVITKTWNSETGKYEIDLVPTIVTGQTETANTDQNTSSGYTYQPVSEGFIIKKLNRIRVSDCVNEAEVKSELVSGTAAGIIGITKGNVNFYDSVNKGKITGSSVGGMIGQVTGTEQDSIRIIRCDNGVKNSTDVNCGAITQSESGSNGGVGGLVGVCYINATVDKSNNYANMTSYKHLGGIIGVTYGDILNVYDSGNYGVLSSDNNSNNGNVGGIVGTKFVSRSEYTLNMLGENVLLADGPFEITILNCESKANITGNNHLAGILGEIFFDGDNTSNSNKINISNCNVGSDNANSKMVITNTSPDEDNSMAGILGFGYANIIKLNDNNVKNLELIHDSDLTTTNPPAGRMKTAGIAGHIYTNRNSSIYSFDANNNTVDNLKINVVCVKESNKGGLFGAIIPKNGNQDIGKFSMIDNKVVNSEISGTELQGYSGTGGLIGCFCDIGSSFNADLTMLNCDVINTDINVLVGASADNLHTGGLAGLIYGNNVTIKYCDVISNENEKHLIKCEGTNSHSPMGGLIGISLANNQKITNSNIKNMKIEAGKQGETEHFSSDVGGVIGVVGTSSNPESFLLEKINVENVDINEIPKVANLNSSIGGFIANIGSTQKAEIKNSKIKNSNITGSSNVMAGMVAFTNSKLDITNIDVTNLTINENKDNSTGSCAYGGIIAYAGNDTKLSEVKVNGLEMNINEEESSISIGGFVGHAGKLAIENSILENARLNKQGIYENSLVSIGGLLGSGSNIELKNNIANTVIINSHAVTGGGLVGYAGTELNMDNNKLTNIEMKADDSLQSNNSYSYGGLVGVQGPSIYNPAIDAYVHANAYANNNSIDGLKIEIKSKLARVHAGGFAGVTGSLNVDNNDIENAVTIKDFEVTNESKEGIVGGILGVALGGTKSTLKNITVKGMTANGNYAIGGILGCASAIVDNATVSNMDVDFDETNIPSYKQTIVGGIAGIANEYSEISNVEVNADQGTTHQLKSNYFAGGIAGICDGKLQDAIVKNITVKTLAPTLTEEAEPANEEDREPIIHAPSDFIDKARAIVVQTAEELVNCHAQNVTVDVAGNSSVVNE